MNRLCGLDWVALQDLDDRRLVNEGALAEQFVGQHLLYLEEGRETPRLNYWLRDDAPLRVDRVNRPLPETGAARQLRVRLRGPCPDASHQAVIPWSRPGSPDLRGLQPPFSLNVADTTARGHPFLGSSRTP